MAVVTVTMPVTTTCHYWFYPQAKVSVSGQGVTSPEFLEGYLFDGVTPLSVQLDNSFLWDVYLEFRNAPPITFYGFAPAAGELLTQLTAQGWTP